MTNSIKILHFGFWSSNKSISQTSNYRNKVLTFEDPTIPTNNVWTLFQPSTSNR